MARNPLNFKRNSAELAAADAAIAPFLTSSKIASVVIEGKEVRAEDAPLDAKINALGALIATGSKAEDSAELIKANGELAAQVEVSEGKLLAATATVSAQAQKIAGLESAATTATASVAKLTTDLGAANTLLSASNGEVSRTLGLLASQKSALAARCIAAGCIDFAKDATEADKVVAAEKLSFDALFSAYNGAVNAAVAKTGVSFAALPSAVPGAGQPSQSKHKNATELCRAAAEAQAKGKPVPAYESFTHK